MSDKTADQLQWLEKWLGKEEDKLLQVAVSKERRVNAFIYSYITAFACCWSFVIVNQYAESSIMALSALLLLLGHFAYLASFKEILERNEALRGLHLGRSLRATFCRVYPALSMYIEECISDHDQPFLTRKCAFGATPHVGVSMVLSVYEVMITLLWCAFSIPLKHQLQPSVCELYGSFAGQSSIGEHLIRSAAILDRLQVMNLANIVELSALDLTLVALFYAIFRCYLGGCRRLVFFSADRKGKALIREKVSAFAHALKEGKLFHVDIGAA